MELEEWSKRGSNGGARGGATRREVDFSWLEMGSIDAPSWCH